MDFDKRIFKLACRDYILETVNSSKHLREQLSLLQHAKMYQWAKKLTYEQMISAIFEQDGKPVDARKMRDYESRWKRMAKYGLIAYFASHLFPVTMPMALFLTYMYRRFTDPCRAKCGRVMPDKKCMLDCKIDGIKRVIGEINKARGQCNSKEVKNPENCVKGFDKQIRKWQGRLAKTQKRYAKTLGR